MYLDLFLYSFFPHLINIQEKQAFAFNNLSKTFFFGHQETAILIFIHYFVFFI